MKDAYGLTERQCAKCHVTKPLTEYRVRRDPHGGGFFRRCAECMRKSARESKARHDARLTTEQRERQKARARAKYAEKKKGAPSERTAKQREAKRRRDAVYNERKRDERARTKDHSDGHQKRSGNGDAK